jgi:hypothetical protein
MTILTAHPVDVVPVAVSCHKGWLDRILVQLQSNSRGRLHRVRPRKRHQMRHSCDFACFLAKQASPVRSRSRPPTTQKSIALESLSICAIFEFREQQRFREQYDSCRVVRVPLHLSPHIKDRLAVVRPCAVVSVTPYSAGRCSRNLSCPTITRNLHRIRYLQRFPEQP